MKKIKDVVACLQKESHSVQVKKTEDCFTVLTSVDTHTLNEHLLDYSEHIVIEKWIAEEKPSVTLEFVTRQFLQAKTLLSATQIADLCSQLPKKWSVYAPMVLFGTGSYDLENWQSFLAQVDSLAYFEAIAPLFQGQITHFAINRPIVEEDIMRRPFNLIPLYGNFGPEPCGQSYSSPTQNDLEQGFWCHTIQNRIYQTWAPRYTMFSRGNICEKKRLLQEYPDLQSTMVVDLYAGIGYFTLSYLANGATLFCWEINRWSIEGLLRGLSKNKHKYRLISRSDLISEDMILQDMKNGVRAFVFFESNEYAFERLECLSRIPLSHINLGLLPTLKPSWPIARRLAQKSACNTKVHVHENIHVQKFDALTNEVSAYFDGSSHLEKVKTFAPDVWHVVVDVETTCGNNRK